MQDNNETSIQILAEPSKLFHQPFHEWLNLVLRNDDYINIPIDLGMLVHEFDKEDRLSHVEFPSTDNKLKQSRLWHVKAWRRDVAYTEEARRRSLEDKIAFENMKINRALIAARLKEVTGLQDSDTLVEMAVEILRNNPDNLDALGVSLRKPYYQGVYDILPFREPLSYD
jgi:hypothetical protein